MELVKVDFERYSVELKSVVTNQRIHIVGLEEREADGVGSWMTSLGADLLLVED